MEYQSPGAAFSNAVEAHMAQTAMLKRQAMLDELARKKEERQAKAQDEDMQIRRDEAESRKAEFHQKIGEQKTANVRKWISELVPGDIPTPDMLKDAQDVGLGDQNFPVGPPEPGTGGSLAREGATPEDVGGTAGEALSFARTASQRPFVGSPQQREKITSDKKQEDYINSLADGPLKTAALYELKTGRTMPTVAAGPKDVHSPAYVEYQDYKTEETAAGRAPVGFDAWSNMDANRKKVREGSGNGPQPQIFYGNDGKPHALQFSGGATHEIPLPDNIAGKSNPITATTRTMMEGAAMLMPSVNSIAKQAQELDKVGQFGPYMSRVRDLTAKVGTSLSSNDPDEAAKAWSSLGAEITSDPQLNQDRAVGRFSASLGLMATGAGRVHGGARGGGSTGMLEHFKSLISASGTLPMFLGRLDALQEYLQHYAKGPAGQDKDEKSAVPAGTDKLPPGVTVTRGVRK